MIKSLLDADSEETARSSADVPSVTGSHSILDLKMPEKPLESLDPFAITDRHSIAPAPPPAVPNDETANESETYQPKIKTDHTPEYFAPTAAETLRMTGLAWSAGIMFFGSVGLMMVFGWLVDTVLGSSPWGIVGGIVLGSVIGFVQLVRINTQLLKTTSSVPRSLMEQAAAENNKTKASALSEIPTEIVPLAEIPVLPEANNESSRTL